ncbi:hypothetical protein, partial [Roseomonas rosulenta]|uniref:hypothetical protein n=1 Tax=Roseomonas rosulenta TaxID=2748667 RepID=UPI0018DF33E7
GSEAALAQAEAQAAALERVAQPDPFEAVERGLAAADAAAWQQTEARLQREVAGADPGFQDAFVTARRLLGLAWPLGTAAAAALEGAPP